MANQLTATTEADALHPLVLAALHARIPAALRLLWLVLLSAFSRGQTAGHQVPRLRKDWLFSTHTDLADDLHAAQDPYVLRRILHLRAEIGWLMRGKPNRGMALSGQRAPVLCPPPAARAPP